MDIKGLKIKSLWVRRQVLEMIAGAKKGHIGGAFSCADILTTLFYSGILKFDVKNPNWPQRDRFILSKGHSAATLYAILADLGFFPVSELKNFCSNNSILGGHPDRRIPGIEADTGSLGHGLGIGAGIALSAKINRVKFMNVVLMGDGECDEGSVWEASMFAAHHKLNNLVAIIDRNRQCVTDFTEDCLSLEPLIDKWRAFNWDVRVVDGHSHEDLFTSLGDFRTRLDSRPLVIIAKTIKGKGVSFMEGKLVWHHSVPEGNSLELARRELS